MRKAYHEIVESKKDIYIWGTGKLMKKWIDKIDPNIRLVSFCDTYEQKWSSDYYNGIPCVSKENLCQTDAVLIAILKQSDVEKLIKELDSKGIDWCLMEDAVDAYRKEWDEKETTRYYKYHEKEAEKESNDKIVKYVSCHVPYKNCNLRCSYCYIGQVREYYSEELKFHSPEFIRAAFSKRRLGGISFINFCAGGETLMCKELLPIISEILKEGHYVSIVTNGTVTKAFDEMIVLGVDLSHIFIKFSFHYLELKKKKLLDIYAKNVNKMRSVGCSVSIELVPSDDLVEYIEEIKRFSLDKFGALPHLTVPRDDTAKELVILTKMEMDEYARIWGEFDSEMFRFKLANIKTERYKNCMAGEWSLQVNLETGDVYKCVGNPYIDNIYEDICREIKLERVGGECSLPYCYNCHSYLALGLVEEISAPTYYEVRDRETLSGLHWITDTMKDVFTQKLYENHRLDDIV